MDRLGLAYRHEEHAVAPRAHAFTQIDRAVDGQDEREPDVPPFVRRDDVAVYTHRVVSMGREEFAILGHRLADAG